jgi:hypothetical protein
MSTCEWHVQELPVKRQWTSSASDVIARIDQHLSSAVHASHPLDTMSGFNVNLDAITENASRLGMRIQETFSEHTRDLVARGSSALYLDAPEDKLREVKKQLDTGSDRDKIEALKRLIAVRIFLIHYTITRPHRLGS